MNNTVPRFHRRCRWVSGAAITAWAISLAPGNETLAQPAPGRNICFYVDKGLPGHVFVQLHPVNNAQACQLNLVYGKYPKKKRKIFNGPGEIKDDSKRPWTQRICFPVNVAQYNGAAAKIRGKLAAPPPFKLLSANCVDWAKDVAAAAGLALPNSIWRFGIDTPGELGRSLKNIGNGGVAPNGGKVKFNAAPGISASGIEVASVLPRDWDTEEVANASQADPAALASTMALAFQSIELGAFSTTPANGLAVNLTNVGIDQALFTIDWGDATIHDLQLLTFAHTYSIGLYPASLVVVDCATVTRFRWTVNVTAGGQVDNMVVANVATPLCSEQDNFAADFPPAPSLDNDVAGDAVPTISEWAAVGMTLLLLIAGTLVFFRKRGREAATV